MLLASGTADEAARAEAGVVPAGLFYSSDAEPGITQVLRGKTFAFRDSQGRWIRDAAEIARIRKLAIPPAYRSVWICASANGHPTVLALETLRKFCGPGGAGFTLKQLLGEVSQSLGNTPAVCRKAYIHPRVLELGARLAALKGEGLFDDHVPVGQGSSNGLSAAERRLVAFLCSSPRACRRREAGLF